MSIRKLIVLFVTFFIVNNCDIQNIIDDMKKEKKIHHQYCQSKDKVKCYEDIIYGYAEDIPTCWDNFDIKKTCSKEDIYYVCHSGNLEDGGEFYIYFYNTIIENENYKNPLTGNSYKENDYIDLINDVDEDNNEECAKTYEELEQKM